MNGRQESKYTIYPYVGLDKNQSRTIQLMFRWGVVRSGEVW